MDLDQAWEEFQKNTAIKKSSLRERMDTMAAQLNEIQTDTKRMADIVPKLMGDATSIDAANQESAMSVPPMDMGGAGGAEDMLGNTSDVSGGPEGGLTMENEDENGAVLEEENPESLEEGTDKGILEDDTEENADEGILEDDTEEGADESIFEDDTEEDAIESVGNVGGGGAVEKLRVLLQKAMDNDDMSTVSDLASIIAELEGGTGGASAETPVDTGATNDVDSNVETNEDDLSFLDEDDDEGTFSKSEGAPVDDALSENPGEKMVNSDDSEDAIIERIMGKIRGIVEDELGIGASEEQLEEIPEDAEVEIEVEPMPEEVEGEEEAESEKEAESEEEAEGEEEDGKSIEENKAIADNPIEECDKSEGISKSANVDIRDLYYNKLHNRFGVDGVSFRKADLLDKLKTPGSMNAGAAIDKEGVLGELSNGEKASNEHTVGKDKDLIDTVDERKDSSENNVDCSKELLDEVDEQKTMGSDHTVDTNDVPLNEVDEKKNMTEHTVNKDKSPIDNVKGITTKTTKSAARPPASASANGNIMRPEYGEFKKSSAVAAAPMSFADKMDQFKAEIRQDWKDYYDNVARKGLIYN